MKKFLSIDFSLVLLLSLFGGLADGFSSIERDETFCFIQTGNLVRMMINFIGGEVNKGLYALIIFLAYIIFVFIFWFLLNWMNKKKIDYMIITIVITGIFFIPSIIFKFDETHYLDYGNLISGIMLSGVGAMIATSFSKISFNKGHSIVFNAAIMTGNSRSMMMSLAAFVKTKDKEKGFEALCYFLIIISFVVGITSTASISSFASTLVWQFYGSIILIYACLFAIFVIMSLKLFFPSLLKGILAEGVTLK